MHLSYTYFNLQDNIGYVFKGEEHVYLSLYN